MRYPPENDDVIACRLISSDRRIARKISRRSFEKTIGKKSSTEEGRQLSIFVVVKYDPVPDSVLLACGLKYCKHKIYPGKHEPRVCTDQKALDVLENRRLRAAKWYERKCGAVAI